MPAIFSIVYFHTIFSGVSQGQQP